MKKRRITAAFSAAVLLICQLCFSGCEKDDGKGYIFGYDISANPGSLDPQCADDSQSSLLISNIYEGLLSADSDGNISGAGAESYTVSDDGLTYTFILNEDRYWVDMNGFDEKCTAKDYVYGFTRLFIPETRSPRASEFFCIKNSEKINKSEITDVSQLGVRAENDYKLIIELEYANPALPMLLTTAPAMPCNEKYFLAAQGKYGLSAETTPSNGPFYLKGWSYDRWSNDNNNLVLRYNERFSEHDEVYPLGLNFFIDSPHNFSADFLDGTSQNVVLTGTSAENFAKKGFSYEEYSTAVYGLMMNTEKSVFKNAQLRYALLFASDTSQMKLPFGYTAANSAVPDAVRSGNLSYHENGSDSIFVKPDEVKAYSSYQKACENVNKEDLHSVTVIAVENRDEELVSAAQELFQQWQAKLGFYCSVVYLSESEYNSAIASGNYTLAFTRFSGEYNSPDSYLKAFTKQGFAYSSMDGKYSELLNSAKYAKTLDESYLYCKQAEKLLLTDGRFIPLAFLTEYFFSSDGCSDVKYNPFNKTIDYTKAIYID